MKALSSYPMGQRRQDPVSCNLCRLKKRRCDRKQPCSNCQARGVPCERETSLPTPSLPSLSGNSCLALSGNGSDNIVLAKLDRLEHLMLQMQGVRHDAPVADIKSSNVSSWQQPTPDTVTTPSDRSNNESAHKVDLRKLEDVGTRENLMLSGLSDGIRFEILPVEQISSPNAHTWFTPSNSSKAPRIILFPSLQEALTLFDVYAEHVEYLHHILLLPKVRTQIYAFYDCVQNRQYSKGLRSPALAPAALLLSIFASSAACINEVRSKSSVCFHGAFPASVLPFSSTASARHCTVQWLKNTFECLDYTPHVGPGCLEDVQATTTAWFLVYNLEGFSTRARTGLGRGILMGRDVGLHRLDLADKNDADRDPAETEIARRTWWHLCASDWLVALSGGPQEGTYFIHPHHMQVRMPRNINDSELLDPTTPPSFEHPLSVPTSASYLIQRIKLGIICRKIADAVPMSPSTPETISYEDFIALDQDFERFFSELPPFFQMRRKSPNPEEVEATPRKSKRAKTSKFVQQQALSNPVGQQPNILTPGNPSVPVPNETIPTYISIQRFVIHLTSHTRRCKLHQPYLVCGFTDPKYHYSRDICLQCARIVIEMQQELDAEGLVATGLLGLSGLNHHLFFATIALLMDLCFNRVDVEGEDGDVRRKQEVKRAIGIMQSAKDRSLVVGGFLESIDGLLKKYRIKLDDEVDGDDGEDGRQGGGGGGGGGRKAWDEEGRDTGVSDAGFDFDHAGSASGVGPSSQKFPDFAPEPQLADFDEIWRTFIAAPMADGGGWEEEFNSGNQVGEDDERSDVSKDIALLPSK